jgi:hypothetical protein
MIAAKGLSLRLESLETVNEKMPDLIHAQSEKEHLERLGSADSRTQLEVTRILSTLGSHKKRASVASKKAHDLARATISSSLEYGIISHIILDMSLVYLVSEFESFLQQMISLTLSKMPGPILDKTLTLKQLTEWKNIRQAKRWIIEKEVHEIKLTNPDEADDYFSRKFNVRLSDLPRWVELKERFYRRNAIIHQRGQPDQKYREKTGRERFKPSLEVSSNYLATSITLFRVIAPRIARRLERKFGAEWPKD